MIDPVRLGSEGKPKTWLMDQRFKYVDSLTFGAFVRTLSLVHRFQR
jgi:hypothetical protein